MAASSEGQIEPQGIPLACPKTYSDFLIAGYRSQNLELDLTWCNEKIARFKSGIWIYFLEQKGSSVKSPTLSGPGWRLLQKDQVGLGLAFTPHIYVPHKVITTESLVTICHGTYLLRCYWLYGLTFWRSRLFSALLAHYFECLQNVSTAWAVAMVYSPCLFTGDRDGFPRKRNDHQHGFRWDKPGVPFPFSLTLDMVPFLVSSAVDKELLT